MRYRLNVIGITYNQIESGVYALVLEAEGTDRRIPIRSEEHTSELQSPR